MASKQVGNAFVRLIVEAGKASPSPPVGPALGARGVKAMDFCKLFNAQTAHYEPSTPMRVKLSIAPDRTFTFQLSSPPTSHFFFKTLGIAKGAGDTGKVGSIPVGELSLKHVYEIAKIKKSDPGMDHIPLESVARSVVAQAHNMGIKVIA
ncbi:uncharacterized protein MELLADRAFT_50482 [Melampsora larici-populina 98AG31]|uniref:Large ribosomal subunit protein uL11m n=1 Tax=Melampsora larici-populina (strain 98AG31 / pathotype 3-4-7) TaxID=747676 RepID=F4S583_MELLP|nr:uncharacterized protein MELLADRAFT_50482 [Melampsora larici-populina 98AG31]EGG00121.1 hypothetical protein MELLADRAFT_50482 [Melampsora larici-populina 98AG31]